MQRGLMSWVSFGAVLALLPLGTALAQGGDTARLSLDECLQTALANNLELVSARNDPRIAEQQIEVNEATFDGGVSAGVDYIDQDGDETIRTNSITPDCPLPPCIESGSSAGEFWSGDVGFRHELRFGGNYSVTYDLDENDGSSTSIEATTGFLTASSFTQDADGFTLMYEMPLLNGFGKEVNTLSILLAEGNLEVSKEELRRQAIETIKAVEDAYWDVLAAREAVRISELALERAEDLLELNKKKVDVGTLAPIEITEAEAGVASQVENVIVSKTTLENAEDALLQLMAVPENSPMWEQPLDLIDRPSFVPVEVDLDAAIATALEQRPEMIMANQRLRDDELSQRVAKRGLRHGLDLTASITPDKQEDIDRFVEISGAEFPSDTTTESEDTNWTVGLRYTYAIRNRAAKAQYAIAKYDTAKSDLALRNTEQQIRVDVRTASRNLESGIQRVEAARKNVELQAKKLEAEQKKFDNGMSTSFEVLTFQNDLADAELSEIRARLEYLKSLTALERSKGTLLEARGLTLAE